MVSFLWCLTLATGANFFLTHCFKTELSYYVWAFHKVVDHYENPRNVGSLDKNSKNVGTGLVGAPACGDVMKLQVRRRRAGSHLTSLTGRILLSECFLFVSFQIQVDENGKILDARFKTFGCGSAIASSSLATEWVKGKSVSYSNPNKKERGNNGFTNPASLLKI